MYKCQSMHTTTMGEILNDSAFFIPFFSIIYGSTVFPLQHQCPLKSGSIALLANYTFVLLVMFLLHVST